MKKEVAKKICCYQNLETKAPSHLAVDEINIRFIGIQRAANYIKNVLDEVFSTVSGKFLAKRNFDRLLMLMLVIGCVVAICKL